MRKLILCGVSAAALMNNVAYAQEKKGNVYVELNGFLSFLGKEASQGDTLQLQNDFRHGGGFAGIVGYDFGEFRLEGEVGKHYHLAEAFNVTNDGGLGIITGNAADGKSNATHFMVNAVYDFDQFLGDSDIEPFAGVGVGLAKVGWNNFTASGANDAYTHGSDNVAAYQAFAGVRVPLTPNLDASLKYRYLGTNDADRLDSIGNSFKSDYDVHDIVVGITYRFGDRPNKELAKAPQPIPRAPVPMPKPEPVPEPMIEAPAPAPMPAPEPEPEPVVINKGPYSVYFGFDSSDINSEAASEIAEAATEAKKDEAITIEVSGHADRSGANQYNETLALKRAEMVKSALVREGINPNNIMVKGSGELVSEVNTADGVKEGRNRRVTILLK